MPTAKDHINTSELYKQKTTVLQMQPAENQDQHAYLYN